MAGHIDVRVKVAAPLDVLWEVANPVETVHEVVEWNQDRNSIVFRINPGPDASDRTWEYQVERIVNVAGKTAYARRWDNENFRYSYAFWQYTGSDGSSELRCVADFELVPGAPMDDAQMAAFMSRGTQAAMQKTAQAAEAEAARRSGAPSPR